MKIVLYSLLLIISIGTSYASKISFVKNNVYTLHDTNKVTALVQSKIDNKSVVGTEANSMCELSFDDKTVTRIGANSVFSYSEPERIIKLKNGTFLVSKSPETATVVVEGGGITAAVAGSTVNFSLQNGVTHIAVLETTAGVTVTDANGKTMNLQSGQGMSADSAGFSSSTPSDVNVATLASSELCTAPGPLENAPAIAGVASAQAIAIANGFSFDSKTSDAIATATGVATSDGASVPADGMDVDTAAGATAAPDTQQPRAPASLIIPPVLANPNSSVATPI